MDSGIKKVKGWFAPEDTDAEEETKFIHLAPTDKADEAGVYSEALKYATDTLEVSNIALTGPYGSGKSSVIKAFLKKYKRPVLQISLAAFLPETNHQNGKENTTGRKATRQEIERSILQQMLYGADAHRLPFSRFKRIQSPRWSHFISLQIVLGVLACGYMLGVRDEIFSGKYFLPLSLANWFNYLCFAVGFGFLWQVLHHAYVKSFGVSLKSISLKDIEIAPQAVNGESILNRHLDEIIYFFQSTPYDLVVIEDLDRFNNPEIFVTLREINSIINANVGVKRPIRFLYALRDNMFVNTDRTKFFEFIVPVIPIINSSNSIDKMLEQGHRLSLDERLDRQFLREVSRYLDDMRLIQNIYNEYLIYVKNLETDSEGVLDANKLLAVLIYKNVFPSDFEKLHRGNGGFAEILSQRDEHIASSEAKYKSRIAELEEQIDNAEKQTPSDLRELRKIYVLSLFEKFPDGFTFINSDSAGVIPIKSLAENKHFDQIIEGANITVRNQNGHQQNVNISGFQDEVDPVKSYQQRKKEIERKSSENLTKSSNTVQELSAKISTLRVIKFNEIIRQNAGDVEELFDKFGDKKELARFLVYEGFLDDTYYQYTSLFHSDSGRLSPNDNKYLIQIRAYINPEPDSPLDNPKEVIAGMRDEDFQQNYVLNICIVDCLLDEPDFYDMQISKLNKFVASSFDECQAFFSNYYARGRNVSAFLSGLVEVWPEFINAAIDSSENSSHVANILAHLPEQKVQKLHDGNVALSDYLSSNLSQVLVLEIGFKPELLTLLDIKIRDLSSIEAYPKVSSLLMENGHYQLSVENMDFVFHKMLGWDDLTQLHARHYSTVLETHKTTLISKVEDNFDSYLKKVLLRIPENSEEDISAIIAVINHEEIDIESLEAFLAQQSSILPALDDAPARLHVPLIELEKIEASWNNCLTFLSSENFEAEVLTTYLSKKEAISSLSQLPIPDGKQDFPLRKFLIENDGLSDDVYRTYVSALPKEFKKFPENLDSKKLQIVIEEKRVTFSTDNFALLNDDSELEVLFVAKNIDLYLRKEAEFNSDDDFRELLLSSDILDEHKLEIIDLMDLTLLTSLPSRAAKIGGILAQTGADIGGLEAEAARSIIENSKPIANQISLFNKFETMLDDDQVRATIQTLPEPFSEIKSGYRSPKINKTQENLELVKWLDKRDFISSWSETMFSDKIRINLYRKRA